MGQFVPLNSNPRSEVVVKHFHVFTGKNFRILLSLEDSNHDTFSFNCSHFSVFIAHACLLTIPGEKPTIVETSNKMEIIDYLV